MISNAPRTSETAAAPYVTGRLYPLDVAPFLSSLGEEDPVLFLETARVVGEENRSYLFRRPVAVLTANGPDDVRRLHHDVEAALAQGYYLAGWWDYEWGYALEPTLHHLLAARRPQGPLVWLGVFHEPEIWTHDRNGGQAAPGTGGDVRSLIGPLGLSMTREEYVRSIERVKRFIAAGDTYQVNYTLKGRFHYSGCPIALYRMLRAQQAVSYGAVIRTGDRWILSLSPELFFRRDGDRLWSKPMKGTIRRGRTTTEDAALARHLAEDTKSRAENVMIVDLLRNDIGRLAVPGTVSVPDLFQVERYETLFQMVSRIEGRLCPGTSWDRVFRALFPCGSVTGAPKIRTMELIAELEREPRGVYTGAVGFLGPGGQAVLNVAIRTIVLEGGAGEIGIGSGIVADSDPEAEYEECGLKARFLTRSVPDFQLIETMRWEPGRQGGYYVLERHLARLADSAAYFGFPFDEDRVRTTLSRIAAGLDADGPPQRVRLLLGSTGTLAASTTPLVTARPQEPVRIALSPRRVRSTDRFLYHKTTHRDFYEEERRRAATAGLFEFLFLNERGELTEGTVTNVFLRAPGESCLWTPPLSSGLLPGTLREELLATDRALERVITPGDLDRAAAVYVGNSVQGLLRAVLVCLDPPDIGLVQSRRGSGNTRAGDGQGFPPSEKGGRAHAEGGEKGGLRGS